MTDESDLVSTLSVQQNHKEGLLKHRLLLLGGNQSLEFLIQ